MKPLCRIHCMNSSGLEINSKMYLKLSDPLISKTNMHFTRHMQPPKMGLKTHGYLCLNVKCICVWCFKNEVLTLYSNALLEKFLPNNTLHHCALWIWPHACQVQIWVHTIVQYEAKLFLYNLYVRSTRQHGCVFLRTSCICPCWALCQCDVSGMDAITVFPNTPHWSTAVASRSAFPSEAVISMIESG